MLFSTRVKMFSLYNFRLVLTSKTIHHFLITSGGTAVNGLLGLLFYVVVARGLGPASYGILAVAITSITVLADIADLGIDTTLLRFVSKYRQIDPEKPLKLIKLGLSLKLLVWIIILLLGWLLAPSAARLIFLKPELAIPLRLSLIGAGGAMFFSLTTHVIQAYEKFWVWSFLNIGLNTIRIIAIGALIFLNTFSMSSVLWIYIALPFAGFFLSLFFLPSFLKAKGDLHITKEFFNYSKWIAVVGILSAVASRLDTFISARLLSVTEVGLYAAAVQLSIVVPQLVFALATVIAPRLAGMNDTQKTITYLKKTQLLVTAMFLGGVLISPAAFVIIPAVYGQSYNAAILPFIILFLAQLVFLLALPAHQAIYYYFSKPNVLTFVTVGQLIITAGAGWFLISNFGILGAAFTVLINNLFAFIIPGFWVIHRFKKGGRVDQENNLGTYAG